MDICTRSLASILFLPSVSFITQASSLIKEDPVFCDRFEKGVNSAALTMSDDKTWSGWASKKYNDSYNSYVPWLEDKYLGWYGENKTSYTAKGASWP